MQIEYLFIVHRTKRGYWIEIQSCGIEIGSTWTYREEPKAHDRAMEILIEYIGEAHIEPVVNVA